MSGDDLAESGRLAEAIERLLPQLDEFVRFDDPTRGGREREHWATQIVEGHPELELLRRPTLSICCFRYRPAGPGVSELDELNEAILRRLRAEGRFFRSSTRVAGADAIRPCYLNPRTTVAEVDGLAEAVVTAGRTLTAAFTA